MRNPLDQILTALVALAFVAVIVSKSSKTNDALQGFFDLLSGLISQIMGPLNSQKGA